MAGDTRHKNKAVARANLLNENLGFITKPPYEISGIFPPECGEVGIVTSSGKFSFSLVKQPMYQESCPG